MKILLNHTEIAFDKESLTVSELLRRMKYTFPLIHVRINGTIIAKDQHDIALVRDGDRVEAFHLIGGG